MIKWMIYTGKFFIIQAIGYSLLEMSKVSGLWYVIFFCGNLLYYYGEYLKKDS